MSSKPRVYPRLSIEELCRKLESEQGCVYKEIHQDFAGRLRTGAQLKRGRRSFPFFPDTYSVPLSDYEIRETCKQVGLDADDVFPPPPPPSKLT
jgi:hypothetical protein